MLFSGFFFVVPPSQEGRCEGARLGEGSSNGGRTQSCQRTSYSAARGPDDPVQGNAARARGNRDFLLMLQHIFNTKLLHLIFVEIPSQAVCLMPVLSVPCVGVCILHLGQRASQDCVWPTLPSAQPEREETGSDPLYSLTVTHHHFHAVHVPFFLSIFMLTSSSGFWSVCEDASGGREKGEEEQADAGQRRVQENDGGCKARAQVKGQAKYMLLFNTIRILLLFLLCWRCNCLSRF